MSLQNNTIDPRTLLHSIHENVKLVFPPNTKYLYEFCQFMAIKILEKDFNPDNAKLSPGGKIDEVWHHFLLYPIKYTKLFSDLGVEVVGHNPDKANDTYEEIEGRYQNSLAMLHKYYKAGPRSNTGWGWTAFDDPNNDKELDTIKKEIDDAVKEKIKKGLYNGSLRLYCKTMTGETFEFNINPADSILTLKLKCNILTDMPVDMMRIICNGYNLDNDKLVSDYNIQNDFYIHVLANLVGC